jgi:hypothetical protein
MKPLTSPRYFAGYMIVPATIPEALRAICLFDIVDLPLPSEIKTPP